MNKDASIKFRLQEARILNNAIQHYWKRGRETSTYLIVARWAYAFCRGREDVHKKCGAGRLQSASGDAHVNALRAFLEEHHY